MKICTKCRVEKEEDLFYKKRNGLQPYCKDCSNQISKDHYKNNKSYYKDKAKVNDKNRISRIRKFINDYKSKLMCVDCGESNPIVLEFDHVTGKKAFDIGAASRYGIARIEKELEKCVTRCANCHRIKTFKERGWA